MHRDEAFDWSLKPGSESGKFVVEVKLDDVQEERLRFWPTPILRALAQLADNLWPESIRLRWKSGDAIDLKCDTDELLEELPYPISRGLKDRGREWVREMAWRYGFANAETRSALESLFESGRHRAIEDVEQRINLDEEDS